MFHTMVVVLQLPDPVQRLQRGFHRRPLHQLCGDHGHGLQDPTRQNGTGNQGTHAQLASADHQRTAGHQQHIGHLLEEGGEVLVALGDVAHLQFLAAGIIVGVHPTAEHAPTALARLDGFRAFHGFHQQAGFQVGRGHAFAGQLFNPLAVKKPHRHRHHQETQGDERQERGANDAQEQQEQNGKRRINHQLRSDRREETAHRLVATKLRRQGAHTAWQLVQPQAQETQIHGPRQSLIHVVNQVGVQMRAQVLDGQFKHGSHQHPQRQYHQGLAGAGRHHAVVDLHAVEGHGQRDQVQHQTGQGGFSQHPLVAQQFALDQLVHRAVGRFKRHRQRQLGQGQALQIMQGFFFKPTLVGVQHFHHPRLLGIQAAQHQPSHLGVVRQQGHGRWVGLSHPLGLGQMHSVRQLLEQGPWLGVQLRCRFHRLLQGVAVQRLHLQLGDAHQAHMKRGGQGAHGEVVGMGDKPWVSN